MSPQEWEASQQQTSIMSPQEWDKAINPQLQQKPYGFFEEQPKNPPTVGDALVDIGTGAVIGGAVGSVVPVIGTGAGALAGGLGAVGDVVGRNLETSEANRLLLSAGAGELGPLVKYGSRIAKNLISAADYRSGRVAGAVGEGVNKDLTQAIQEAKIKAYGKDFFDLTKTTGTANTDETTIQLAQKYMNGLVPINGDKVSDVVRREMYDKIRASGSAFIDSPEYAKAKVILDDYYESGKLSKQQYKNLVTVLNTEKSGRPGVVADSTRDILNLVQSGGKFELSRIDGKPQTATLIPENARLALKEAFDNYTSRIAGQSAYGELKAIEKAEFVAQARDLLPKVLQEGMKLFDPEVRKSISILRTTPEGKSEFAKALNQQFSKFDNSGQMLSYFEKNAGAIRAMNILPEENIDKLYKLAKNFDKSKDNIFVRDVVTRLVVTPLIGVAGGEGIKTKKGEQRLGLGAFTL